MSTKPDKNLRFVKPRVDATGVSGGRGVPIRRPSTGKAPALDATDLRLLEALRQNGRESQEALSILLSLSRPAVRERMRRLESAGVLRRYTVDLDWELLGFPILAFVRVQTKADCHTAARQVAALSSERAVIETCQSMTGKWSLFVKVRACTSADLEAFLERIYAAPTCAATATTLVLSTLYGN